MFKLRNLIGALVLAAMVTAAHAQTIVPIPSLPPAATPLSGSELLPCAQGGITKACMAASVAANAGPTVPLTANCNGAADNAATINAQLATLAGTGGIGVLPFGDCAIASTVTIPGNVILAGRGPALNWAAIGPTTTTTYPTRLKWIGAASGVMLSTSTSADTSDLGVQNLTIDGGVSTGNLATSSLKGLVVSSTIGFTGRNLQFQNIGWAISFEPNYSLAAPNQEVVWGHYDNIHMVNVGYCARFSPDWTNSATGGTTNNFFYDFHCYSYYQTGLDFYAQADDNRFTGLYLLSGVANSKAVVFNSASPSTYNGVYANDLIQAELDMSDTTGTQSSLVVNNTGSFSSIFQGVIGNEGSHYDPVTVNAGGSLYYWDALNGNGPVYYSGTSSNFGLTLGSSNSAASASINLSNNAQAAIGQFVANGSTNGALGGPNSVNVVNSTNNPVDIWSGGLLAGLFTHNGAQILGTSTNNDAPAGYYGEFTSVDVPAASAVALTTGVSATVASLSLTAGDWQVCYNLWTTVGASTVTTALAGGISSTSATLPTAPAGAAVQWAGSTTGTPLGLAGGCIRLQPTSTTTYYEVANATFTTSTLSAYGHLEARRVR